MADFRTGVPEENTFAADSVYGGYRDYTARTGALPTGYGESSSAPNFYPDVDPLGVGSTAAAMSGSSFATSGTVTGLKLADGSWRDREELMQTDMGRRLVKAEEDIRKGHRRGFLDGLFSGSLLEYLPFTQMFASVGGSVERAGLASSFYDKMTHGREGEVTEDERLAGSLHMREQKLNEDGSWWYKVGSILKQAPAFYAEFGMLGKIGQVARARKVAGMIGEATDAAAEKASTWALTRAAKIGFDEYAESAIRLSAKSIEGTGKTFAQAVRELAASPEARKQLVSQVAERGTDLVEGMANAAANPSRWAPGLSQKVSAVRAEKAVESVLSRWSSDSVTARMWQGLKKATADSVAEGIMDLGTFGTDASTVINTFESSAGKAALRGVLDLTVGAAARGSVLYFPKEAVSRAIAYPLGAVNKSTLALREAAFVNDDEALFDRATRTGMFLDLLEYVSENTGRGFSNIGRAIGLKVAPGLMAPARRVAGVGHIAEANVIRDSAGKISKIEFSGLFDPDRYAEVGGRLNRFLTERWGGKAMREKVINDEMASVTRKLAKANVRVSNPAALQASLEARAFQPGVSGEIRNAIGYDIKGYVKAAVKEANDAGLKELKLHGARMFTLADWMTRKQIDPVRAARLFEEYGYDGVIGEMLEERYSDFMSNLFGLDARKDVGLWQRFKNGLKEAVYIDAETGKFKPGDMLAEAFAFAVPLVARGAIMHGIARLGGANRYEKDVRDWPSLYADVERYSTVFQGRKDSYVDRVNAQMKRLSGRAEELERKADEELAARGRPTEEGMPPRVEATDEEIAAWRDEAKRYRTAVERSSNLLDSFIASIAPRTAGDTVVSGADVPGDTIISAPIYRDSYLLSTEEEYNLALHPTEDQMRGAMSAYSQLVNGSAEAIQTQFRMDAKAADEPTEGFRRIGHWVAETALRLGGTAITGDVAFMAANPARWAANDYGLPDDFLSNGKKMYAKLFAEELKRPADEKIERSIAGEEVDGKVTTSEYEAAHERALRRVRPFAERMMRELIAAHQTRMFSYDEINDIAVSDVARDMDMAYDPDSKEFFNVNDADAPRVTYDSFVARPENRELIESTRQRYTEVLYDALSRGMGIEAQSEGPIGSQLKRRVADVMNIPRGLPTEKQVIYARTMERLAASLPQFRDVTTAQTVDPNKTIDDQTAGTAVRASFLKHVRDAILPEGLGMITKAEDIDAAVARIDRADPAVVERIARDLRLDEAYTAEDIKRRNTEIAMLALRSATVEDGNVTLFSRMATEDERNDRFGNPTAKVAPARKNTKGQWTVWVREPGSRETRPFTANTIEDLESFLKERYGYERVQPKVVYTATDTFTADTAFDMIRFLGLGEEYEARMANAAGTVDSADPAARRDESGDYLYGEDDAAVVRDRERRLAELHEQFGKQNDKWLYMPAGTERTEENGKKAAQIAADAKAAWYRLFQRTEDGKAVGYLAVAEDLLRQWGCSVRYAPEGKANVFGLVSPSLRGRYSIGIRAMHSSGLAQNVYVPISHLNAQDYSSALLEASLATRFSQSRAYLKTFISPVRGLMDEIRRVCNEFADSVRAKNPELADKVVAFKDATVEHGEGQVRGMTPQTFATFVSAFNLFRTEVPPEWQRSVLGPHAEALVAIAPKVRQLTAYLGWTGVVDRMLGGSGLELEALTGDSVNINAGLARYYALFNPWYVGANRDKSSRKSLRDAVESAFPDGFREFANRAVNNMQAAAAPRIPQPSHGQASQPGPVTQSAETAERPVTEDPIAALRVAQQAVIDNKYTPEQVMSVLEGGDAADAGTPVETDESGMPVQSDDDEVEDYDDVEADPDQFMVAAEAVQAPVYATTAGTKEAAAPKTKAGLLPSEVRTIARTFQRMSTSMLGQEGRLPDLKSLVYDKLAPDTVSEDWKTFRDAWESTRDDGRYAADWDFGVDGDEEGVLPDGVEGNNARAVNMLKSKAMNEFLALMNFVTPTSGRDFQPLAEDMRSNLAASKYLIPESPDADLVEALDFVSAIANPRAIDTEDGASGRDSIWRHHMSLFDDGNEAGRRTVARYVRALLGKEGEPPVNARAAVLLTYLTMLPTNVRMQLASLLGSCAPATPVRLSFSRETGKAAFLVREVPKRSGSMSFGVLSSTFARLAGKTASEINAVADGLDSKFRAAMSDGSLRVGATNLIDASGKGVLNQYAKILAPVFGADSSLVTTLVSSNVRARLQSERNSSAGEKSEWSQFLGYFAPREEGQLPEAASVLVETVRGLAAVTNGKADRRTLVDRALDMFQSDSPNRRNLTGATTSLQGAGIWKKLLRAYAESKPTSIMTAEINPERTNRPASSLAITMPGIEPALQQFMDRRSDDLGFEGVLRTWFRGYADLSDAEFKRRVSLLRRSMQWPGVPVADGRPQSVRSPSQIVAKSISKTAMASEVISGCEAAYELEGLDSGNRDKLLDKYGQGFVDNFVKRNMVYVPVYSGDHSSSILIQVPLAAEFREAGMSYDEAAELVSTWVGLDLLGADAKRSATTSNEGPGTSMWDYAYDEKGDILKDAEGNAVRGHAYTGIIWNSDPDADNEAMIGSTGFLGYGAMRQKEMAKDPQSGTIKCHMMATGEDKVYGPLLSLIKSLSVSVDGSHGDFLEGDPKRFVNDFAKKFLDGLEGGATRNSVAWSDFDSIKLGVANSKTIGVENGDKDPLALMKHVFGKLRAALNGELKDDSGNPVEIGSSITGEALDKLVGSIEWANFGGTGKKGRFVLSQLLDGVEIREIRRDGDFGGHRMFALMFRTDSVQAFTVANVSHAAKAEFSRTPRNYMLDSLAMSRTLRTWNADDMNGWAGRRIFNNVDGVCDDVRDLVSGWGLTGAIMSRDPRSIRNMLRDDEEYQALLANGEPAEGNWAREQRMRVFAANAKKNNLNVPILGTDYALVSNAAWIDKDGAGHSHSSSQMFNDTLQGPRAIDEADREFLYGHRRAGLCNVNSIDPSFRYGLYVDDAKLESEFAGEKEVASKLSGLAGFRRTVMILDTVISRIVEHETSGDYEGPYRTAGQQTSWRERLARCLLDHHGNAFSSLVRPSRVTVKGKDGKPVIDPATGQVRKRDKSTFLWQTVSYADLFTDASTDRNGAMRFDRTAVYENMHDSEGVARTYLGGTMFGFPRTPSYNGSMVFQTLRAALPVTETYDENRKAEWKPGRDAMVAPDPFTLKVLGCDHDGDKAKLYMLSTGRNGKFSIQDIKGLLGEADALIREMGVLDGGFTRVSTVAQARLDAHVQRLIGLGVLEYERVPDGKDAEGKAVFKEGALVLTRDARSAVSNAFVQGLFDMSRMLPFSAKGGDTVIAGEIRDGGPESGSAFGSTMAAPGPKYDDGRGPARRPEAAWDVKSAVDGVLGTRIFDVRQGKILRKPRVAARAQDSVARASEARAIMVNVASSFHFGYMCGFPIGPFASRRDISGKEWIDWMYHLDHLSNMSFDDIKEQICSRLGFTPGMIETIIADMLNDAGPGRFPITDQEFLESFCKYAMMANDKKSSRYWMARAADPTDYEFRTGVTIDLAAFNTTVDEWVARAVRSGEKSRSDKARTVSAIIGSMEDRAIIGFQDSTGLKNPVNGYAYWLMNVCPASKRLDEMEGFADWLLMTRSLKKMKSFANAVNFSHVDPAANTASEESNRLDNGFVTGDFMTWIGDETGDRDAKDFGKYSKSDWLPIARMRAATVLMYDRGVGEIVAAKGLRAKDEFHDNCDAAMNRYLLTEPQAGSSTPGALVVHALHVVPRLGYDAPMQLEANAQSVDVAFAAFNNVPFVAKSPINTKNAYDVLDKIGRKLAMMRHPENYGTNVTLDVLYGIETMLDVVARFTKNSYAGTRLGIFNYLNEVPNANSYWYDPKVYGGAAKGLSRITLGMGRTGAQIDELRDLVRRVVVGRELDSDGVLGSLPYASAAVQDDIRSAKHYWTDPQGHKHWREGEDISFALSTENLRKMKALLVGSKATKMKATKEQAESGTSRNLLEVSREELIGPKFANGKVEDAKIVEANLPGALDELIAVFEMLDKYVAPGFKIEPSALFGQLLPLYAAISSRTEGVPDADTPSLLAMFPDVYASWAKDIAKYNTDPRYAPFVMANIDVNWAPVKPSERKNRDDGRSQVFGGSKLNPEVQKVKPRRAAEEAAILGEPDLRRLAEDYRSESDPVVWLAKLRKYTKAVNSKLVYGEKFGEFSVPSWEDYADPKARHVLSVFDGARGVLFKNTALVLRGMADEGLRVKAPVKRVETKQPVQQPVSSQPVVAKRTDDAEPKDAYVQKVADRMAGIMKMWDMGRVEYRGGNTFQICGRFHEGDNAAFETRIDVEVLPEGEAVVDDEKLAKILNGKNYRQSLALETGKTLDELDRMAKDGTLFAFAKANRPIGVSRTFRPGHPDTSAVAMSEIGEWRVDAARLGVLTGRIRLARQDEHENVIYHEYFHSVMGFMRTLGAFSQKDIVALQKRYGEDNRFGDKWFNEEKAAEEFRAMMNEGTQADKSVDGIWSWVRDFLNELWSVMFDSTGSFSPDDYANGMEENPLASIVLTGRFRWSSLRKSEPRDFLGKIDKAVDTYLSLPENEVLRPMNDSGAAIMFWAQQKGLSGGAATASYIEAMNEFLGRINAVGYPDRATRSAEIKKIVDEFNSRNGRLGNDLKGVVTAFMKEYGPVSIQAQPNAVNPGEGYVNHSGGAVGSDTAWGEIGAEYGVRSNHYWHGRKTPNGNVEITQAQYEDGVRHVRKANETLKRRPDKYMSLLARNWQQVANSSAVFAVGTLASDGKTVDGGTGWAVQMAADTARPIHLFDQKDGKWKKFTGRGWEVEDTPVLTKNFAGIGTREITDAGKRAIRDVYEKTFTAPGSTEEIDAIAETTPTTPNPKHESDISDLIAGPDIGGFLADAEPAEQVLEDAGFDTETAFMCAPVHESVRAAMRKVNRMNRPYTRLFSLAREIGLALRDGTENVPAETADFLSSIKEVSDYAIGKDRALNAMRKVASLYGVDVSDPQKAENLLFRAINELSGELGSETWTKGFGQVRLADGTKRASAEHVSPAVIAAAISTSLGVRPNEVIEAAIEDLNAYVRRVRADGSVTGRYPEDNTFVLNVINPVVSALTRLSAADPSNLMLSAQEGLFDDVIKSIRSGFVKGSGGVNSDGTYRDFEVSKTPEASDNPYFESNRLRYMDHEGNPDFHGAIHRALDAAYMAKASMKFCRAIGFEPGRPEDFAAARQLAPNAPEPLTLAEMASSMAVAPEQLTQENFEIVTDYDQTWFCAAHPEAWLDSMTRPGEFGGVDFREQMQGVKRQIAGFHHRSNSLNVLMARRFGLDVMPGQGVHARVEGRSSDFTLDGGKVRYLGKATKEEIDSGKRTAVEKYNAYDGVKAKADGREITVTLNDQRMSDMFMKACKVKASGGALMLTGVDGLTFSLNDLHDEDWYSWDKVQDRAKRGIADGYNPLDKALLRLHRQLADDVSDVSFLDQKLWHRDESWDAIIGKDGLDLYDRIRSEAVAALREAKTMTESRDENGNVLLLPNEVNDFVLGRLEDAGLVKAVRRYSKALGKTARTEAAIALRADEVMALWDRSDMKAKLEKAGRSEKDLSYEGYAEPLMKLYNEVRRFIADTPFLSDGDGAFFHNATTPLPFAQGSGFFMYYANRRERGSKLKTDSETMNRWESAFDRMMRTDAILPAATADAEQLLLFKELFHTNEKDVESIRKALGDGAYENLSPSLTAEATVGDLCKVIYQRMTGMLWADLGDETLKNAAKSVGEGSIGRMVRMYERHRMDDASLVAGGVGMTDELVYEMTGCLPHNDQLGHAVQRTIDGITNAYAFRSTLYAMLTAPDEDGMPVCYALPSEDAADTGGLPDEIWGSIAKWWAHKNGIDYDITKSGIWNARNVYSKIHAGARANRATATLDVGGTPFAELKRTEIDQRSIEGFMAQATTLENESKLDRLSGFRNGGYAIGYAKHLLQSTRGLGQTWQRAAIHRALAYSKGLSVSFSYFFPLTTRFESPIAASGLIATAGGNFAPNFVREHAESLSKLQTLFRGKGWISKDFTGQRDVFDMLDSNDPYLSELYHWAGALGLTISDANANVYEGGRAILEEDMRKAVAAAKGIWGSKFASRLQKVLSNVLLKGGERAFTYHMNATKLAVASQLCTRFQAEAAKAGKAFDPVRDLRKYSAYINSEIGGIDPLEYAWAHPAARNLLSQLFFSWEWTRGSWMTGYNAVLEQILFGGHGVTKEQRQFLPGRMARLFLTVGIGYPMLFQIGSKAIGMLILKAAGIDPDDGTLDEDTRKLVNMVIDTPWFTWQNEDKTNLTAWDVTPLAAAMAAAFPNTRDFLGEHPFLRAVPAIAAAVTHKPWLLAGAFPIYTGRGDGNKKTMGRHLYAHSGKQLWEDPRWWTDTTGQFFSKLSMPLQRIAEGIMGRSLTWLDHPKEWAEENDVLRWLNPSVDGAAFNLLRAFVPFSATSVGNFGDAGFLSMVGPVQMGASSSDVQKRIQNYVSRWASNDRRGYAFGGPIRSNRKQSVGEILAKGRPEIAHLVREAMFNGLTEKDAYRLVTNAIGKLTGDLYSRILDEMPLEADGDYDVAEMGTLLRKAQRLGRLPQDIFDAIKDRLVAQSRWGGVTFEAQRRMAQIILDSQKAPYGTEPVRYDY